MNVTKMAMTASMIGSTSATKVDKSTFTSSSKNSARFSSMVGRAPVLSPTCTISSAIPGKNPLRPKPELSVCPAVTAFCASPIDWESSGLVTESLVVSSAGMIGRPPCTSVESVRANSATENFISNLPATGERNFRRSHHRRVAGDRRQRYPEVRVQQGEFRNNEGDHEGDQSEEEYDQERRIDERRQEFLPEAARGFLV